MLGASFWCPGSDPFGPGRPRGKFSRADEVSIPIILRALQCDAASHDMQLNGARGPLPAYGNPYHA